MADGAASVTADAGRTIAALAALVDARLELPEGFDGAQVVEGLNTVDRAGPAELTFVGSGKYARMLESSKALAASGSRSSRAAFSNRWPVLPKRKRGSAG